METEEDCSVEKIGKMKQEPVDKSEKKDDLVLSAAADNTRATESLTMSHKDAMKHVDDILAKIIPEDPLLQDLPGQITLEEVNSMIALEHGQAMVVYVRRADDVIMPIVVVQDASVLELKQAIKRYVMLKQARTGGTMHISWRHLWKRYWLYFENQKLSDDKKRLKEYGIRNKAEVSFIKRLKEK